MIQDLSIRLNKVQEKYEARLEKDLNQKSFCHFCEKSPAFEKREIKKASQSFIEPAPRNNNKSAFFSVANLSVNPNRDSVSEQKVPEEQFSF